MDKSIYDCYVNILKSELLSALGCTEPIAVAYAAALARDTLGELPERVEISVSGNILKNVKGVVVPHTDGLKGIDAAASAGIIAGNADKELECISGASRSDLERIRHYLHTTEFSIAQSDSGCIFDIFVRVYAGGHSAGVRIVGHHTNVVRIEKDGQAVLDCCASADEASCCPEYDLLRIADILAFADEAEINDVREALERQIEYNSAIAEEGLKNDYGARVGKLLLKNFGNDIHNVAKATAAAGSDARMNGCTMPVVIVSGSGNQGMTASLPVIVFAKHLGSSHEELLRALVVSNLVTVRLKARIGRLSAYCGAVSAGCGAAAGVCKLRGGSASEISHAIVNAIAIDSGIICDGAKSSCAAKIASAVEAGLIGMEMALSGTNFSGGDGILVDSVEGTIDNVGDLARQYAGNRRNHYQADDKEQTGKYCVRQAATEITVLAILVNLFFCLLLFLGSLIPGMWGEAYVDGSEELINGALNRTFGGIWYVVFGSTAA